MTGTLHAGQSVDYSYLVANTGNVPLSAVTVTETTFTGTGTPPTVSCPAATLAPGGQETCTATYTITLADVNAGHVDNAATASGTQPSGLRVTSPASSVVIPEPSAPGLSIRKTANPAAVTVAGDRLTYSFAVTNTGNVTLTDVLVDETAFSGTGPRPQVTCPSGAASLTPGVTVTCTASYTVTQADMDAGHVDNTATASGTPPSGPRVTSPPSSATVTARQFPVITLAKTPSPRSVRAAGDMVTYTFVVGNAGDVTLHDVTVTEADFTGTGIRPQVDCPGAPLTLAPRQTATCTATYRATQADAAQTRLSDTAHADGTAPDGRTVHAVASAVVQVPPRPALALVKTASPARVAVGGKVRYTFAITNTGDVTVRDVTVIEEKFTGSGHLSPVNCPAATAVLAPGGTVTCTASYTVTAVDAAAGKIANTAIARGRTSHGRVLITPPAVTSPPRTAAVTVIPSGVIAGFPGKPTRANALLLSAGGGLILGGLILGALLLGGLPLPRRRLTNSSR